MFSPFRKDNIVLHRYKIIKFVGSGTSFEIFSALDLKTNTKVHIRIEDLTSSRAATSRISHEARILYCLRGLVGFPRISDYGVIRGHRALVTDPMGATLENYFNYCHRRFTINTIALLGEQVLLRLESLHNRGFIHRDITPTTLAMGVGAMKDTVHIIDFSYTTQTMHTSVMKDRRMASTLAFASVSATNGLAQTKRDDMEAVFYLFLYFYLEELPWGKLKARTTRQLQEQVCAMKLSICNLFVPFPTALALYVGYVRGLSYNDTPDYVFARAIFKRLFTSKTERFVYDWITVLKFLTSHNSKKKRRYFIEEGYPPEESYYSI